MSKLDDVIASGARVEAVAQELVTAQGEHATALDAEIVEIKDAIAKIPTGDDPALDAVAASLNTSADRLQTAVDALKADTAKVAGIITPPATT